MKYLNFIIPIRQHAHSHYIAVLKPFKITNKLAIKWGFAESKVIWEIRKNITLAKGWASSNPVCNEAINNGQRRYGGFIVSFIFKILQHSPFITGLHVCVKSGRVTQLWKEREGDFIMFFITWDGFLCSLSSNVWKIVGHLKNCIYSWTLFDWNGMTCS